MRKNRNSEAATQRVPVFFVRIDGRMAVESRQFASDPNVFCGRPTALAQNPSGSGFP